MSKLLINEHPLQVLPSLAVTIGLNEAIVLQQIHYWAGQRKNEIDGHSWVYNSVSEWRRQFPFWSEQTIRRAIATLKERGLLIAKCLSPDPFNRTPYYRVDHDALAVVEHSNLEPTNNHNQNGIAVYTKLKPTVYTKLEPTVDTKLASTLDTETNQQTTSETNRAGAPASENSDRAQGDLLGNTSTAKLGLAKKPKDAKLEAFDVDAYLMAEGVDFQVASDWLAVRKKKTGPNTLTAFNRVKADAAKVGITFAQAVTYCAEKGHAGFYVDAWKKDAQAMGGGSAPAQRPFMTTQERNRAISEANARAFLEDEGLTPFDSLPPPNAPMTIDME